MKKGGLLEGRLDEEVDHKKQVQVRFSATDVNQEMSPKMKPLYSRWTWRMSEPWIEAMTFGAVWKRVDGLESKPHPEHIAFQHLPLHLYLNAL